MKAAVEHGYGDLLQYPVDACFPAAEFKGLVRQAVLEIKRPPLGFSSNHRERDTLGESLTNIQAGNASPGVDLLRDNVDEILSEAASCWLWFDYQEHLEEADRIFIQAREVLSKHRRVSLPSRDELQWTAKMRKAARSIRGRQSAIFQHETRFSSVTQAARWFWPECYGLEDCEVFALMAADQAYVGAGILLKLMQSFDESAIQDGIEDDDNRELSRLRRELAEQEMGESRYGFGKLGRAKDLLYLAQMAEISKDSALARQHLEERDQEFMRRETAVKPLVEKGAAFSHGKGSGQRALSRVIREILKKYGGDTPAKQVWKILKGYAGGDFICEVTDDEVSYFKSGGSLAKPTSFKSFQTHLSGIRKEFKD